MTNIRYELCKRNYNFLNNTPILGDSEQGAVSVGSPSQAAAEGALLQLRDLNFLQLDEDGLHPDHSPHSAQVPAPTEKKIVAVSCVGMDEFRY